MKVKLLRIKDKEIIEFNNKNEQENKMRNLKKEAEWAKAHYQQIKINYRKDSQELAKLKQLAGNKTLSQFVKEIVDEKIERG
jgi:predicted lipid-binding transport protein (Tim44 family)